MSSSIGRSLFALVVCLSLVAGGLARHAGAAGARHPADSTSISGTVPWSITQGPGNTIWFVEENRDERTAVARIAPSGAITTFPVLSASRGQHALILGPDGNLWLAAPGSIGRLSSDGRLTSFPLPSPTLDPGSLLAGPDGNLWFATDKEIGRITLRGKVTEFPIQGVGSTIIAGLAGDLWWVESQQDVQGHAVSRIDRRTAAGQLRSYPLPKGSGDVVQLALGSQGTIWFAFVGRAAGGIGAIGPSGAIAEYPLQDGTFPTVLTVAPNNEIWVGGITVYSLFQSGFIRGVIDRVTPKGQVTALSAPGMAGYPSSLLVLADGTLWFTEGNNQPNEYALEGADRIGRITAGGVVSEFQLPAPHGAVPLLAVGADGSLWFCEPQVNKIGKVTPDGQLTDYLIPTANSVPSDITAGPDGSFWFIESARARVGRITPGGLITEFPLPGYNDANSIASGPDGNLWITARDGTFGRRLVRLTPRGQIVGRVAGQTSAPAFGSKAPGQPIGEQPLSGNPTTILAGKQHDLWLLDAQTNSIGHQGLAGAYKEYTVPTAGAALSGIAVGPDGNLWFTESYANKIGYLTPAGVFREFSLGASYRAPLGITAGADGALWFAQANGGIGRVTTTGLVSAFAGPPGTASASLAPGPGGSLWFIRGDGLTTGLITMRGAVTTFAFRLTSAYPTDIVSGPGGDLWITLASRNAIGRVTTAGQTTILPLPHGDGGLGGIASGPDGNLWITIPSSNSVDRLSPSGAVSTFRIAGMDTVPGSIVAGPDHNLWFVGNASDGGGIDRLTPDGVHTTYKMPDPNWFPIAISAGPDGNLWFTAGVHESGFNGQGIARITPSGKITLFTIPTDDPYKRFGFTPLDILSGSHIITGPDGNLWYTNASTNSIGRITPSGRVTEFALPTPMCLPSGITRGADGKLWFVEHAANKIGTISPSGQIGEFTLSSAYHDPTNIVSGPDGSLWVTEPGVNQVARVSSSGQVSEFAIP